jgi:hypothetical protein
MYEAFRDMLKKRHLKYPMKLEHLGNFCGRRIDNLASISICHISGNEWLM